MDKRRKIRNNKNGRGARNNGSEPDQPQAQRQPSLKKKGRLAIGRPVRQLDRVLAPVKSNAAAATTGVETRNGVRAHSRGVVVCFFLDKDAKRTTAPAYRAEV